MKTADPSVSFDWTVEFESLEVALNKKNAGRSARETFPPSIVRVTFNGRGALA